MATPQQARRPHFKYQRVQLFRSQSLGVGSYGAVYKAQCDELPCAGKLLHPILFQTNDLGARKIIQRFEQECEFLKGVRHPNIVQYLGTYRDPESGLPVLLIELMDESLTRLLERSVHPLLYHTQVNLCHDIALALAYLHSNGIVHRDLSSNNVLLIADSRAKVTDFGMSRLLSANPRTTPFTQCPGTEAYMSPEALKNPPVYSEKLDCFSFGVLSIQIMTREFPNPGPAVQVVEDPRYPMGRVQVLIPEAERRKFHIDLIDPNHLLLPIALNCLAYNEEDRPSAQALCHQLAALKAATPYTQSVQQSQKERSTSFTAQTERHLDESQQQQEQHIHNLQDQLQAQGQQLRDNDDQLQNKDRQLLEKDAALLAKEQEIQQVRQELEQATQQLEGKDHTIEARERQLRELNQEVQANEQAVAGFQQKLLQTEKHLSAKDEEIRDLKRRQRSPSSIQYEDQLLASSTRTVNNIKLTWKKCANLAPSWMYRGAATVDGTKAYFTPGAERAVYAYNSDKDQWSTLPECPCKYFSLVVVRGFPTTVGGLESDQPSNKLFSLTSSKKWSERFPPMPTKRYSCAATCTERSVIVTGGKKRLQVVDGDRLSTVEVMDTETLQWFIASNLPHPYSHASATLYGSNMCLLGGNSQNGSRMRSVLTCSIATLLSSCRSQSLRTWLTKTLSPADQAHIWTKIADVPVYYSTCATLCGQLLAVGGVDPEDKSTTALHMYNPKTESWIVIDHMPTANSECLLAPLPGNRLMVVCGEDVYIASVLSD